MPPAASILVVDDTLANLRLLSDMLQARGYRVRPVPSGPFALQAASVNPPDLVLLDIDMPDMDGYQVCARLKADPRLCDIPVIFISALSDVGDKIEAFRVGGVDYVTKPFHFEEVEARVRTHLELARLRRGLVHHNTRLEDAVAQRTRELADAHARLGVLDRAKSDFLSLISHELRTPLCGIFGVTDLLLMTYADDPAAAEYAALYGQSRSRLLGLIDDALLFCQIGATATAAPLPQCPLADVLATACAQADGLAQSHGVQFAPLPATCSQVDGEAGNLVRALQALLETAAKFAHAGTLVRLAETSLPGEVCLRIETEGPEVPPAALTRFFSLLAIAEALVPDGDLGLAPALAERIVTLYGGSVAVENLQPPGIRLTVRLGSRGG
jgi:DNA-binding response OmpR family regulator